jgi:hypothetical protein
VKKVFFSSFIIFLIAGCIEPYNPPDIETNVDFMVVDGYLNSGNKTATVKLSTAVTLNSSSTYNPIQRAFVQIEGDDGLKVTLAEIEPGTYYAPVDARNGEQYQLRFNVSGKEYLSDKIELKRSPVLDSVNWRASPQGVSIDVDSHDESGSTDYYLWTFTETWEYNSQEFSQFKWENRTMTQRRTGEFVYVCFSSSSSTKVLVTSTSSNSLDVVNDFQLTFIPKGSRKLSRLYSILVEQRAMDKQAYTFWRNLQKSTENLGGLFDPLPSEVTGNIHNVQNPQETVLGYFSGGEVQQKRMYIDWNDLPIDLHVVEGVQCDLDTVLVRDLALYNDATIYVVRAFGAPATVGYLIAPGICADCRRLGGSLEVPEFWPR